MGQVVCIEWNGFFVVQVVFVGIEQVSGSVVELVEMMYFVRVVVCVVMCIDIMVVGYLVQIF